MSLPTRTAVQTLLTASLGTPVEVAELEPVRPWQVAQTTIRTGGGSTPVLVKWMRSGDPADPDARADPRQLRTEAGCLSFLADLGVTAAPRLIAADDELVVMSHLDGIPLDRSIRAEGYTDRTIAHLTRFATALAEQHAATHGHARDYYDRLRHLDPVTERRRITASTFVMVEAQLAAQGCPPADNRVHAEAVEVARVLDEPGDFLAMSNGDPATNNFLVTSNTGAIIDFEFAGYRHCLSDLVEFYVPGPGWLTLADPRTNGVEAAYRDRLAATIPTVTEDARFDVGLVAACLSWAARRLSNFSTVDARPDGEPSQLQRLVSIEAAARLAEQRGVFPALAAWWRGCGRWLRNRWSRTDLDWESLPPYLPRDRDPAATVRTTARIAIAEHEGLLKRLA